jgi:hypothetical protein
VVEPHAVPLSRLNAPELRDLVVDVTRTLGLIARPFGFVFPPATEEEATAIAAPAARMLAKAPIVQKVIRKIADPVVLTGAIVALFANRPQRAQRPAAPVPHAPAAAPSARTSNVAAPPDATGGAPPIVTGFVDARDLASVNALREQILNGIAHVDQR